MRNKATNPEKIGSRNGEGAGSDSPGAGLGLVPAAERAMRIFEAFERIAQPLTLSRLAEEIDAPMSSCHNLVRTLIAHGYLFSLESQRAFYPTRKLWDVASSIVAHDPVLLRMMPRIERLRDETAETVIVGKRQERSVLYLLVLEGPQNIRYVASSGRTIPLHTSAIGKALLSTLEAEQVAKVLGNRKLTAVTPRSTTDPVEVRKEIESSAQRGYFMTAGENVPDVGAIAAPLNVGGETLAIAVAGPVTRIQGGRQKTVQLLKEAVQDLEHLTA